MYSESDIDGAVAAGVMPAAVATGFRNHVAALRAAPAVDEEHFRLITGFNDIFVAIALALLFVALGQIGAQIAGWAAGLVVTAAAWALAEYFTRHRRMALPSILLLAAFIGGVVAFLVAVAHAIVPAPSDRMQGLIVAVIGALTTAAAALHWRRFAVPITVAAGTVALTALAMGLLFAAVPALQGATWVLLLIAGIAVFAVAMRWDMGDRERKTRRADVAFWLHLAAAPMIAHSTFQLLGVFDGEIGLGRALLVLALYILFAALALAVDRRALLVSSLVYVLYAMYALIRSAGAVELSAAFTGLAIGSALLTLSAFWQPMRRLVIGRLGTLANRLPPVQTFAPA